MKNPDHIVYEISHFFSPVYVGITRTPPGSRAFSSFAKKRLQRHIADIGKRDTDFSKWLASLSKEEVKALSVRVVFHSKDREEVLSFERCYTKTLGKSHCLKNMRNT